MFALMWELVALLYVATGVMIMGSGRTHQFFDANNTVTISLPQELFIDLPNGIIVRSLKPLIKVTVNMTAYGLRTLNVGLATFDQLDARKSYDDDMYTYQLKYYVPVELKPGSYINLNITYFYCSSWNCSDFDGMTAKSVDRSVQIVSRFVVIMGETDKPLYRPGDEVKFRFLALTSRNILPQSETLTWPKYRAVGEYWEKKRLEIIDPHERQRRMKAPFFDLIEIKDPLDNILQQWKEIKPLEALNLTYILISDAMEGEWKIEARVRDESEEIKFQVRHYVQPRFQAHIKMPKVIHPSDTDVLFGVCATYTDGHTMLGTYDAQICVCNQNILERHQTAKELLPKNQCSGYYDSVMRTCMRFNGILDGFACSNITANVSELVQGKPPTWMDRIGVFVEVVEEATGSSIVVSDITNFQMWPEPKLELKIPSSFRHGIPIAGQILYRNVANVTEELELIVREVNDPCGGWVVRIDDNPTRLKRIISVKAGEEVHNFVLPPLYFKNGASVMVREIRKSNSTDTDLSPGIYHHGYRSFWRPPRPHPSWDLSASKRLQLWDDSTGLAIQVTVINSTNVTCPASVNLQVDANKPLPDNTILTLQFLSRGRLITRTTRLEADYECMPLDNEFGHYECGDGDEIHCLEGWTGANCQTPVCEKNGCGVGGICVAPGRCECKPGWGGVNCEICLPRKGCKNGVCVEGGDCVCKPGFTHWLCDKAVVSFEEVNGAETTPSVVYSAESQSSRGSNSDANNAVRRTVFKHKAILKLDGDFGPEFRGVTYVVVEGQMASDFVEIGNLHTCSSPALADTDENREGLRFDKTLVAPGEKVNISIKVRNGIEHDEEVANTCLFSIIDVATKNFDTENTRRIDFEAFVKALKDYQRIYRMPIVQSTESAYQAAGIDFTMFTSKEESIKPVILCPMYSVGVNNVESRSERHDYLRSSNRIVITDTKPRLRDFHPEVWLFETSKLIDGNLNKSLTVPDTLTTWEANAVCFTADKGLWMPVKKPQLTVRMPFFVEFAPPLMARRGEVLHLPISVFVYPEPIATMKASVGDNVPPRTCYEVEVSIETDSRDWRAVSVSAFTTCICAEDVKETFYLPLRPLRTGLLNVTATAVAQRGSSVCSDGGGQSREIVTVKDAVRRAVRVIAEGVEKRVTVSGIFCTSRESLKTGQEMKISIPDIQIVEGSLRSYLTVSGNIVGRALTNLDSLIQLPTGCGEQNLVKVAPSVYVLRYLLNRRCNNNKTNNSHYDHVMKKAASYILSGFDNQLTYRHPENGAFSIWGPQQDSNGSTWLTAYVFQVFSEAEMLPITSITGQSLDAHATLSTAFDFLSGQQRVPGDGCFEEPKHRFLPWMHNPNDVVTRLHLTAHVLAALGSASTALREAKGQAFTSCVRSAIKCIDSAARQLPFTQWSTLLLAKVVHATSAFPHEASSSVYNAMVAELKRRSVLQSTISGSLRWWPESTSAINTTSTSHLTKVLRLETTAYALMALTPIHLSQQDQLATMKWISQQQNEKGGFYSTQDTVVALRALAHNAASFPSPVQPTLLSIRSTPKSTVHAQLEVNAHNNLVAHTFEIGPHNLSDITTLRVTMQSSQPVCVSAHFTTIYNVPEPRRQEDVFELDVSVDQGGNTATAACTTALTTVCLRTARAHATGMLLVTVQLPSGWMVTRGELGKAPLNADVQKVELDAQKQVVSAYFNGFSEKDESEERCFTVASHQRAFVEEVQPGLVTARDYYNPREMVQAPLKLNTCQLYWDSIRDGVVITNIPSPSSLNFSTTSTVSGAMKSSPKCPKCGKMEPTILIDHLNKSLCFHERPFYIFFTHGGTNRTVAPGLLYSFEYANRLASWNTTINILESCECDAAKKDVYGFFAAYIQPGALNIDLTEHEVVAYEDLVSVASRFKEMTEVKLKALNKNEQKMWCVSRIPFFALLKKLAKQELRSM